MKQLFFSAMILLAVVAVHGQSTSAVLATANGRSFTADDLPSDVREAYTKIPETLATSRSGLFTNAVAQSLVELEASERNVTPTQILTSEVASKLKDPTDDEVRSFYDSNRAALGGSTFEAIRTRIFDYLKQKAGSEAYTAFVETLKAKYKPVIGKDVNAKDLKPSDVLVTIKGKPLTVKDFQDRFRGELYEAEAEIYDLVKQALEYTVFDALVAVEAKSQSISSGDLIAKEITDKLKEFTPAERAGLEDALKRVLFSKYKVQLALKMPTAPSYTVATDDDPSEGAADAPVTIVVFSDFQCPACGAAHPLLKRLVNSYTGKVRLIVRDFPLESIHTNAFNAALAAGAAAKQGKFFEYIDLLYSNQKALDDASLRAYALKIGLKMPQFEVDFSDPKNAEEIRKDQADGVAAGITGTPTIFVNGVKVREWSEDGMREAIDAALRGVAPPAKK